MPRINDFTGRKEFRVMRNPFAFGIVINYAELLPNGNWNVAQPLTFQEVQSGFTLDPAQSMLAISPGELETQLMSELWRCGLRPADGDFGKGHIDALNQHIKDLQAQVNYQRQMINNMLAVTIMPVREVQLDGPAPTL